MEGEAPRAGDFYWLRESTEEYRVPGPSYAWTRMPRGVPTGRGGEDVAIFRTELLGNQVG